MSTIREYLISQEASDLAELAEAVTYNKNDKYRSEASELIYRASELVSQADQLIKQSDELEDE